MGSSKHIEAIIFSIWRFVFYQESVQSASKRVQELTMDFVDFSEALNRIPDVLSATIPFFNYLCFVDRELRSQIISPSTSSGSNEDTPEIAVIRHQEVIEQIFVSHHHSPRF